MKTLHEEHEGGKEEHEGKKKLNNGYIASWATIFDLATVLFALSGLFMAAVSAANFIVLLNRKARSITEAASCKGLLPWVITGTATSAETLVSPITGTQCAAYRAEVAVDFEFLSYDSATEFYALTDGRKTLRQKEKRKDFVLTDGKADAVVRVKGAEIGWRVTRAGALDVNDMRNPRLVMSGMGGESAALIDATRLKGFTGSEELLPLGGQVTIVGTVVEKASAMKSGCAFEVVEPSWPWRYRVGAGGVEYAVRAESMNLGIAVAFLITSGILAIITKLL